MRIGIFTGVTSVRSKNILTDISRYPTRKHEIIKLMTEYKPSKHSSVVTHDVKISSDQYDHSKQNFYSLPDDKILDWSILKQIADDILKCI